MIDITFVIPCYQAADTMRRTLDSICGQSDADWKAIIVNDGSPDEETDIIARGYAERDPKRLSQDLSQAVFNGDRVFFCGTYEVGGYHSAF